MSAHASTPTSADSICAASHPQSDPWKRFLCIWKSRDETRDLNRLLVGRRQV